MATKSNSIPDSDSFQSPKPYATETWRIDLDNGLGSATEELLRASAQGFVPAFTYQDLDHHPIGLFWRYKPCESCEGTGFMGVDPETRIVQTCKICAGSGYEPRKINDSEVLK